MSRWTYDGMNIFGQNGILQKFCFGRGTLAWAFFSFSISFVVVFRKWNSAPLFSSVSRGERC